MTGYYVLTNIMGGRPDDPTPEQIAAYCKSFQEGTSELDRPAWDEADYYARAGFTTVRWRGNFRVAVREVEMKTYGEIGPGRIGHINTKPPAPVWSEADFRRANEAGAGTGDGERAAAWAFDLNLGE